MESADSGRGRTRDEDVQELFASIAQLTKPYKQQRQQKQQQQQQERQQQQQQQQKENQEQKEGDVIPTKGKFLEERGEKKEAVQSSAKAQGGDSIEHF